MAEEEPSEVESKKPTQSYFQSLANIGNRLVSWFAYSSAGQDQTDDEDVDDGNSDNGDSFDGDVSEMSNGASSPQVSSRVISPPPSLRVSSPGHRSPMNVISSSNSNNSDFQSPIQGGTHNYFFMVPPPQNGQNAQLPNFQFPGFSFGMNSSSIHLIFLSYILPRHKFDYVYSTLHTCGLTHAEHSGRQHDSRSYTTIQLFIFQWKQ